ncbi:MAG TPA: PadR family transcriptional regulator [bacterium]|nr:PadR family transcriptional regulator [bacterium]
MTKQTELLHGTLDALILKTLAWQPRHGYAIAQWIETNSADALRIEQGSLYPALYRLERKRLIEAEWALSETKRQVKVYRLTRAGRAQLAVETAQWARFAEGVGRILLQQT